MTSSRNVRMNRLTQVAVSAALGLTSWTFAVPAQAQAACAPDSNSQRDFDNDGYDDAVVGDPYGAVAGQAEAGTVTVLFGDADCRIGAGARRTLTQADFGETPEAGDHFGWSLDLRPAGQESRGAALAVGAPGEDVGGHADAGLAHLAYLDRDGALQTFTLDQGDLSGTVETGDQLGYSTAISWVTQEDPHRIAFGAPGEDVGAVADAGAVNEFYIATIPAARDEVRQGRDPVAGTPQAGDRFGTAIAYGRLDIGRGLDPDGAYQTLIVGAPGDTVGGQDNAGSVTFIRESFEVAQTYTQDSAGIAGRAESGDGFGSSLAVSDVDGVNGDLVAIGTPGENIGSVVDAGAVTVLKNRSHQMAHRLTLTQATAKVAGTVEAGDGFGAALAFRDGKELGIGIPGEDLGRVIDAGSAQIVRIGTSHISSPYPSLTEDSAGTPGAVAPRSRFGTSLTNLRGRKEQVLAVSSPFQNGGSVYLHSNRTVSDGFGPRSWQPGSDGVAGVGVRFGLAVG